MTSNAFPKLATASIATNFADQMMLALLPLVLVAGGASAQTVSAVVAAHAAAWLVVSMPVGVYADRVSRRSIMLTGALAILGGSLLGGTAITLQVASPPILALAAFVIAAGVVMSILSVFALVPRSVSPAELASANATIEFGRAIGSVAAPALAAALVSRQMGSIGFAAAFIAGLIALAAALRLPKERAAPSSGGVTLLRSVRDGAAFVVREPILRAIAMCAIAWNSAFFALTAVFAPYAANVLGMSVAQTGNAWSIYGIGLMLGSLAASPMIAHLPTGLMFVFGPALSCAAVALIVGYAAPGAIWPVWLGFFALGFGPMTWLVLQTSVRQIVTPNALMGRVGATLSTAIYGVRPLGALAAGAVASHYGTQAALWLSAGLFFLSCGVLLTSPAARMRQMPVAG